MKNDKYISDNGVIERKKISDIVIITACILISAGLIYLGIMAYIVG